MFCCCQVQAAGQQDPLCRRLCHHHCCWEGEGVQRALLCRHRCPLHCQEGVVGRPEHRSRRWVEVEGIASRGAGEAAAQPPALRSPLQACKVRAVSAWCRR